MKVHVGRRSLEEGFRNHRFAASRDRTAPNSEMMLLCYAAECGLKLVLLMQRSLHSTERLEDDDLTHDLDILGKKVGYSQRIGHVISAEPKDLRIECLYLHVLFRYGGKLQNANTAALRSKLQEIVLWVEEQI